MKAHSADETAVVAIAEETGIKSRLKDWHAWANTTHAVGILGQPQRA